MENNQSNKEIGKGLIFLNGALVVAVILMVFVIYSKINKNINNGEDNIITKEDVPKAFKEISLLAKSAYVYDLVNDDVIYSKDETIQLPLASITKLMTALTAVNLIPKDSKITIRKEFLEEEGDTGLLANESWKLEDLLDFSLMVSSNDGVRSVASVIGAFDLKSQDYDLGRKGFITKMNKKALELGLTQTYFINESGLDLGGVSGGYGSAEDISKLVEYILKNNPEILEATKYKTLNIDSQSKTHVAKNTNTSLDSIPGLIASKTGFTEMAGGNLVVVFSSSLGRPIIVVILGSTVEGRFIDMKKLVDASLEYISS